VPNRTDPKNPRWDGPGRAPCSFRVAGRRPLWWASKQISLRGVSFNDPLTATQFLLGGDRVAPAAFSGPRNKFAGCHVTSFPPHDRSEVPTEGGLTLSLSPTYPLLLPR